MTINLTNKAMNIGAFQQNIKTQQSKSQSLNIKRETKHRQYSEN